MKRFLGILLLAGATVASVGCVGIKSLTVSDLDPAATKTITARADGLGILHLIVPTSSELEDEVVRQLNEQGATKNVRIRLQMRDFLYVVQLYEMLGTAEK